MVSFKVLFITLDISDCNVVGLIGHLKNHFKPYYQLYLIMKDHDPTPDEILYAQGKKPLDPLVQAEYLETLNAKAAGITEAFSRQQEAAAVIFSLKFERISIFLIDIFRNHGIRKGLRTFSHIGSLHATNLSTKYIEKPEFIEMMQYGHQTVPKFTLPKREGVRRRVMKLGEKTINDITEIFAVSFT
jgi:hypothetical protein